MANFYKRFLFLSLLAILFFPCFAASAENTISHGVSLFGDLKYQKDFKNFSYVNPNAPKGGNVKLASVGTYDNLNPFILKGVAADGIELTFDTLMVGAADEAISGYGLIAESVELPTIQGEGKREKGKTSSLSILSSTSTPNNWIIFNLRKIAKWHDGTPITADDIVFSFETIKKKGHPQYQSIFRDITSVEKLSNSKVKFIFANNNRELPIIAGQIPIISKAYYTKNEFDKTTLEAPLGSGPYKVKNVNPGRSVTYERVKDYWAKNLPVNRGRYNFDTIQYDYYRDATVAIEALKSGEYDFRRENIARTWANAYNIPQVTDGRMIKETLQDGTPTGMQCFAFNTRREIFKNPRVREAIAYAYDFEWSNKQLFFSAYTRNKSYFGNSEFASSGLPSKAELELFEEFLGKGKETREKGIETTSYPFSLHPSPYLPPRLFTEEYHPPQTDGSGNSRPNLIKAKEILESEGWHIKDFKLVDPQTGQPVKIEFLLYESAFERVLAPFIRNLKKLGIDASIRVVDTSQYVKRIENYDFDMTVNWFTQGPSPGNEQINYWTSSQADTKGSRNVIGIKNPAVDFLVEKLLKANSKEEQVTAAHALDRVLLWNFYSIPQWYSRTHRVIYWNKFGRPPTTPPFSLGMVDTWWVK